MYHMNETIFSVVAVHLQGSNSELAKLVSFCSEISRTLFSGEHKLSLRSPKKKFAEIKVVNDELKEKNTEIPDLRRKFAEIEAERAELKARIAELLRQSVEENKRRDAENAELKVRIEELEKNKTVTTKLESENTEFRDRITKVEQRQMLSDNVSKITNSSNNSSSNFNSLAVLGNWTI
ncbi:hypothetical protein C1645_878452 [Glomus cerebriforme]|uniref:Uncharacterized protein n=1 Tax=Glomus cerebriforme TaxID=658196 RepID=A0A397SMA2_9GLOM|nr:hypothetical protein C1645_878452 [Glomus cerebriforme]